MKPVVHCLFVVSTLMDAAPFVMYVKKKSNNKKKRHCLDDQLFINEYLVSETLLRIWKHSSLNEVRRVSSLTTGVLCHRNIKFMSYFIYQLYFHSFLFSKLANKNVR